MASKSSVRNEGSNDSKFKDETRVARGAEDQGP